MGKTRRSERTPTHTKSRNRAHRPPGGQGARGQAAPPAQEGEAGRRTTGGRRKPAGTGQPMAGAPPRQSGPGRGPAAQARDRPRQPDRREGGTPREPRAHRRTGRAADGRAPTPRSVRHSTGRARRRAREALSARAHRRGRTEPRSAPQGAARGRKRPGQQAGATERRGQAPPKRPPGSAQIKARPTGRGYRLVAEGGTAGGLPCPRGPGDGRGGRAAPPPEGDPSVARSAAQGARISGTPTNVGCLGDHFPPLCSGFGPLRTAFQTVYTPILPGVYSLFRRTRTVY